MTDIPHLAFPFRLVNGRFAVVEQDSYEDVSKCVFTNARTQIGSRPLSPTLGLDDPTFSPGVDADDVQRRLQSAEPRAVITVTAPAVTSEGEQMPVIEIALADDLPTVDTEVT